MGQIVSTHGYRGEVCVLPLTDFPQRFRSGTRYFLADDLGEKEERLTLKRARAKGKMLLLTFAEINSLEEAARLKGTYLQVNPDEVEPLPPGSYYAFQLLGAKVYTHTGLYLGEIEDVFRTGANDVWQVKSVQGQEILLPAIREVILEVDLEKKRVKINPLPGLLD
ncbi:MAG: rRNA processing protein RimM [Clostridia bacterium]|nr:rRNA processing protein RimM [Clostridia bacterium]